MPITPSDSLDLLIAHGPPDATDFAKQIAGLPGAYYAGLEEAYKRRQQDAFLNGLPMKNGQLDVQAAINTIAQTGGTEKALPGIQALTGMQNDAAFSNLVSGGGVRSPYFPNAGVGGAPPPTGTTTPPSNAFSAPPAPRIPSDGTGQSITGIVTSSGFTGTAANNLTRALERKYRVDQTQQLSPEQFAEIQGYTQQVAGARPQLAQQQQPPATAAPVANGLPDDPYAGGLVPRSWIEKGGTVDTFRDALAGGVGLTGLSPGNRASGLERQKIIDEYLAKRQELTPGQKEFRADRQPGESQAAYDARKAGLKTSEEKFATDAVETVATARKNAEASQAAKYRLDLIDHSISQLGPTGWMGTTATTRAEIAKGFNSAADAVLPAGLASRFKINPTAIANVEDFNKQTQTLGFELAKTLGSREAMQIVQQATNSVPNISQSPLGAKLVSSSLRQASQRAEDYYEHMVKHKGQAGADIAFNKQNPPEMYSTRAIAASGIPVPLKTGDEKKVGYLPSGTKYMWNGKPWTKD